MRRSTFPWGGRYRKFQRWGFSKRAAEEGIRLQASLSTESDDPLMFGGTVDSSTVLSFLHTLDTLRLVATRLRSLSDMMIDEPTSTPLVLPQIQRLASTMAMQPPEIARDALEAISGQCSDYADIDELPAADREAWLAAAHRIDETRRIIDSKLERPKIPVHEEE